LFANYLYASSDSPSLIKHFHNYATEVLINISQKVPIGEYFNILEIGCNDGVLLREFEKLDIQQLVGVEPAKNIAEKCSRVTSAKIYNCFFDESAADSIREQCGLFSLICANNVFAHVANLDSLTRGIEKLLAASGVFVFENAYLFDTIQNLYFDQIYHEHLQYYGIKPLVTYFKRFGLEIFDVQHVNTQGGSIRVFVKKATNNKFNISPNVETFIKAEEFVGLYNPITYLSFMEKLTTLKGDFKQWLYQTQIEGKSVSCYGCPAKFTLFSKVFGLNKGNTQYVVDDSPLKQGRFSPGARIPIVSNSYFHEHPTDYCIISVWNMAEAIMNRNKDYQGKFVTLMPQLMVYGN